MDNTEKVAVVLSELMKITIEHLMHIVYHNADGSITAPKVNVENWKAFVDQSYDELDRSYKGSFSKSMFEFHASKVLAVIDIKTEDDKTDLVLLDNLFAAGVDNWEGYEEALNMEDE